MLQALFRDPKIFADVTRDVVIEEAGNARDNISQSCYASRTNSLSRYIEIIYLR
jgi:hypothetical protein